MELHNKRLKTYIHANTTAVIRGRASQCRVLDLDLSTDRNTISATVEGSSGIPYTVSFTGLIFGHISSHCSCPFDHGNVCKHEVALAVEAEAFFSTQDQSKNNLEVADIEKPIAVTPKSAKKYSSTAPYTIPIENVYNTNLDALIKAHASKQNYNSYINILLDIELEAASDNHLNFIVAENEYWSSNYVSLEIKKTETELSLLCHCKNSNKNLCKHQTRALYYISKKAPLFLASKEEILAKKEVLLNAYGFSLKDDIYNTYFDFQYVNGKLEATPKVPGILKSYANEDLDLFSKNFTDPKTIIASQLPVEDNTKPKAFALLFAPPHHGLGFYPVMGNTDKLKRRLTSKITIVEADTYIAKKQLFTEKEQLILESIFKLENFDSKLTSTVHRYQFQNIKTIVNAIDDTVIVGRLTEVKQNISSKYIEPVVISKTHPSLSFKLTEETHFYLLKAYIKLEGKKIALKKGAYVNNLFCIQKKDTYYFYKSLYEAQAFLKFNETPEIRINKTDFEAYNEALIKPLEKQFEVVVSKRKYKLRPTKATDFKKQIYCSEEEDIIILNPILEYNNEHYELLKNDYLTYEDNGKHVKVNRHLDLEREFYNTIASTHPYFKNQNQGFFYLNIEDFVKNGWFLEAFEIFKTHNIEIYGSEKLSKLKYNTNKPTIQTNVNSEIDWFDVGIEIKFGDQLVSLKDIRKSVINKDNFVKLKDGSIGILPKQWVEKYSNVFRSGDVKKDTIKVSKYQLSIIDTLYEDIDITSEIAKNHRQIKEGLDSFKNINNVQKPAGLKANLRNYQKEGLNWLNFLETYKFGGCLADDMGLGKTLQVISFLKHLKNTKKPKQATLIILPTSLIFNWQEEVTKFAPALKYLVHNGTNRDTDTANFSAVDLVFSTYGVVMRDISFLKDYQFHYCILDESQAIKNPNSKRYKTVKLIKANNRLVLTGTPIENNTFDLYAQMSFVNPGLLGTMANFKNEFSTPIDKHKDPDAAEALRKMIHPFLMRRTKAQVATELPEKTEQILYCTMEKEQKKLYDAYKNKYRDYLLEKIDEDGVGKSKMYVLEGLTKLRQICDAPELLNDQEKYTSESVKIQELVKHVTEQTGQHKILVFSQFVKMLNLIKIAFDAKHIQYEYLDGQTKDRQARVANFQNNSDVRVFLISLKAGGTGLNLTAADYVYIVDPWWNPAVEAQAIDRCYRIGQTKKVMAYKMICKDTIEEKIIKYQETKKQLSDDIIQTDESFVKNLSKESITDLFS